MSDQGPIEADLISGLLCRDPNALTAVYDRYASSVYSLLLRLTRNPSVAEDLVQELFLRVWHRARHFDAQRGSLGTWILSMARHLGLDYLRSAGVRFSGQWQALEREEYSRRTDQQDPAMGLERGQLFRSALAKLSARDQQLLQLAYFEGYSQTEIAARLQERSAP